MINVREKLAKRLNAAQEVKTNMYPVAEMMTEMKSFPDTAWGRYAFFHDPIGGRFSEEEQDVYTRKAFACGSETARALRETHPGRTVRDMAQDLGLQVSFPETPNGGGHVIFAQYVEPKEITVFTDSVNKAEELLEKEGLTEFFGGVRISDILLAHEMFHAIEYQEKKTIYTQTEKVELWKKPFSNKSRILALSEMGAMAFAKELTGICVTPYVLDVLLMYSYNDQAACALYEEICEAAGKKKEG